MEHQRGHLDREKGDVERGVADTLFDEALPVHAVAHLTPQWVLDWEAKKPVWLMEMIAEAVGVFIYVLCGVAATASYFVATAAKIPGFGSIFNIALGYGLAATFALTIVASTSGGQISPGFSIAFATLKGFPVRKVPQYIFAQILGGFLASICVYGQFKTSLDLIEAGMIAAGESSAIFTNVGPVGIFALFPPAGTPLKYIFLNELVCNIVLSLVVFAVIDSRNAFSSFTTAPLLIGLAYAVIIWSCAIEGVALNTARDLGGRFACGVIYGSKCFTTNKSYVALAALTNVPAIMIGGLIYTLFLSDNRRPITSHPATHASDMSTRVLSQLEEQNANLRALTRDHDGKSE